MSLSISATTLSNVSYDLPDPTETASTASKAGALKPTADQQIHNLASSGQSASQIATSLGVPVSQVDAALGITSSSTSQATALVALSGRLSVHA